LSRALPFAEACERNKQPILDVLRQVLPGRGKVLEIGSGTGQHVVHFARALPGLEWQPSDRAEVLPGLSLRFEAEGRDNIRMPLELDVAERWPPGPFDAVYSANTAHIMGWPEVCRMLEGIGRILVAGGIFCLYGPFNENGMFTAPSNEAFDRELRLRAAHMGLRDIADLDALARNNQLAFVQQFAMPANNRVLVFRKNGSAASDDGRCKA
jgi:SAM-dependent methyltransferase